MKHLLVAAVLLIGSGIGVKSANILFFFGVSTPSHRIVVWPLVEELAKRGHTITFFHPFETKNVPPNVTVYAPQEVKDYFEAALGEGSDMVGLRFSKIHHYIWYQLPVFSMDICRIFFSSPEGVEWTNNSKFDLVIVDALFNECGFALAHIFNAPHMIYMTTGMFMWYPDSLGFPTETATVPDMQMGFKQPMTFLTRIQNTLRPLIWHAFRKFYLFSVIEESVKKGMGYKTFPSIGDIERNTSLALMNSHFTLDYARSLPQFVIPIGGMHIGEKLKPLPADLTKFIDGCGEKGFIYISFGTAAQISKVEPEVQDKLFNAVSKAGPLCFIWKWEGERPANMPKNVYSAKWMPQQEILAHKKARAFITHGGLMGIEEAIYHQVPLIVFPIFADQDFNAQRIVTEGIGFQMELSDFTTESLYNAINEIIVNKKYKENISKKSELFRDREVKPLNTAVWWTEYILRHKRIPSLTPVGINHYWFENRLLDVWLAILASAGLSLWIFAYIALQCCRCLFKKKDQTIEEKVKKN